MISGDMQKTPNSYRVEGKVHHTTIANLSQCSDEEIKAIKLALKHKGDLKRVIDVQERVNIKQGLSVGAVWVLNQLAKQLGISKALGYSREAKLALWMVLACVIEQGSRLSATRMAKRHAVELIHNKHRQMNRIFLAHQKLLQTGN